MAGATRGRQDWTIRRDVKDQLKMRIIPYNLRPGGCQAWPGMDSWTFTLYIPPMIHRMTVVSNPRLTVFYLLLVGIPAAGAACFFVLPQLWAGAAMAVALFVDYQLFKFGRTYTESSIESSEEEIAIVIPGQERVAIPLAGLTLAGSFSINGTPTLFLYNKENDKLYTIPKEYTGYAELRGLVESKAPFEQVDALTMLGLKHFLKERYFPEAGSAS